MSMNNIGILQKEYCTGCSMCANICHHNAISMISDTEGFLFPQVNLNCTNCGLCASRCPILSQSFEKNMVATHGYAIQCSDADRYLCSSGGAFKVIAYVTIKNGGVVCGAAYNSDYSHVEHVVVDSMKNLDRLYKSKYVQSDIGNTYKTLKHYLDQEKDVVFSGCPCQVAALKRYLNKEYKNLITVDLLCHGVPSPMAYKYFIKEKNPWNKTIKKVDFRDKKYGWGTNLTISFKDGTEVTEPYNGTYFRAFLSGLNMRQSCYHCQWASKSRTGDITLGDFWGCDGFSKDLNDAKGTSIVICNTPKGKEYVNRCKIYFKLFDEIAFNDVYRVSEKTNWAFHTPTPENKRRKCFFNHLKTDGFYKATRYAERQIMDVGIVGWWIQNNRSNYGSTLTDYALGKYIESLGLSVAYISPPNFDREYAGEFNKKYDYRMTTKYDYDGLVENNKYIDTFVVASDVLWFYDAMIQTGYMHMLEFVDDNKKKLAYAASFGKIDRFIPKEELPKVKYLLSRFDSISMREQQGVDVLRDKFSIESTRVLDPVFICDTKEWNPIIANSKLRLEKDYVFAYLMDPTPEKASELKKFADRHHCALITIPDRQNNYKEKSAILEKYGLIPNASLEDYLYCFKHAKYTVTDSFHGLCFSIIFRKPFYALVNRARGASRFEDLAGIFRLNNRLIENMKEINANATRNEDIDYTFVDGVIEKEIERSREWLRTNLAVQKRNIDIPKSTVLNYKLYCIQQQLNNLTKNE